MVAHSVPSGYRRRLVPRRPKLDAHVGFIDQILQGDLVSPKKQNHTIQRIYNNHIRPHQALNMRPPVPETLIRNGIELGG